MAPAIRSRRLRRFQPPQDLLGVASVNSPFEQFSSSLMKRSYESSKGRASRKNYVIKKERETWTDDEHARFVAALQRHGKNWSMIEEAVGTKTVAQIRSHAQKYHEKQAKADYQEQPVCTSSSTNHPTHRSLIHSSRRPNA